MRNRRFFWALTVFVLVFMAGCGGTTNPESGGGGTDTANDENTDSSGGDTPVDGGDGDNSAAQLGSTEDNGNFEPGVISASQLMVTAGNTSALTAILIDADGAQLSDPVSIAFTSPCVSEGLAEIDPAVVDNSTGRINAMYIARSCEGQDTVTATTVVEDATLRATVNLQTQAAPPGSILFDTADPTEIGIRGTGGTLPEQATVSFLVTNTNGGPVRNQTVKFSLNTSVGNIELSNEQATTDANGRVSTTVSSGTVPTSIRITAETVNDAGITLTAQSNVLSLTTGIPDNDSFTVGAETLNLEGGDMNNVTTNVTALLSDRFNNPVPDGTAVNFRTEGGSIDGSCVTVDGQCTVEFRSQNPRPDNGRVTILATAIGEESFTDTNGNGFFDDSDEFPGQNDLPEAFRDDNENGKRDSNEPFVDFDSKEGGDDNYSPASGAFTGVLCNSGCDDKQEASTLNVRQSVVVVLSGSSLNIATDPETIALDDGLRTVAVTVVDERGQVAPKGTTVEVEATQGNLVGPSSFVQANTNGGSGQFVFRLEPEDEPGSGVLLITATTPSGVISRGAADIQQSAAP